METGILFDITCKRCFMFMAAEQAAASNDNNNNNNENIPKSDSKKISKEPKKSKSSHFSNQENKDNNDEDQMKTSRDYLSKAAAGESLLSVSSEKSTPFSTGAINLNQKELDEDEMDIYNDVDEEIY